MHARAAARRRRRICVGVLNPGLRRNPGASSYTLTRLSLVCVLNDPPCLTELVWVAHPLAAFPMRAQPLLAAGSLIKCTRAKIEHHTLCCTFRVNAHTGARTRVVDSSSVESLRTGTRAKIEHVFILYLQGQNNAYTGARTRFVDSTSVECLFSMTPLPHAHT